MLENFLYLIDTYGFIPNGGRVYYSQRSEPPLFAGMCKSYVDATNDTAFAIEAVVRLEKEYLYWETNRTINVKGYDMFIYGDQSSGPRPEFYREDVTLARNFSGIELAQEDLYAELRAGDESGMDFSSRWFINEDSNEGDLTDLHVRQIVPVDLNAILYWNAKIIAEFSSLNGDGQKAAQYNDKAQLILEAIQAVLWNAELGIWLDFDLINNIPRNFFTPTNLAPLWTMAYDVQNKQQIATSVLNYLSTENIEMYDGGIPATKYQSGQQWDFPNVWPPLQYIVIKGLNNLQEPETSSLAQRLADKYIYSNFKAYYDEGVMYEKVC